MNSSFDLMVLGTGEAGSTAAARCRAAGWQVAIVDSRPFGGTCGVRGCDPKKVLAGAAEIVDWQRRMRGKGIKGDAAIDWPELIRFKRGRSFCRRRVPNLNAFAERWVRSVKEECLSKLVLFGEASLRRALSEYLAHFHSERNHQGKQNRVLFPARTHKQSGVPSRVRCYERLSGLLKYYTRAA